jgi:hypothetical protein
MKEDESESRQTEDDERDVHAGKRRKRDIDDVDAESTISHRRRPAKRGRTSRSVSSAASQGSGLDEERESMRDIEEDDEQQDVTPRNNRRRTALNKLKTRMPVRRTPRRTAKAAVLEPTRKRGDEWVDANGMKWQIGKDDGVKRRAVVVKEIRNKYNMVSGGDALLHRALC